MISATFPLELEAAAGELERRRIRGVAVPYEVEGRVSSGETVIFHRGSLDVDERPVALRDHDRTRTIGRVVDAADLGDVIRAEVAVSRTTLGDETLVLAGDRALMFSVGADPRRFTYDDAGRMHVYEAGWSELSLLPIGAYAGAVVTDVTASQPERPDMTITATDTPDVDTPDVDEPVTPPPAEPDTPPDDEPDELEAEQILAGAAPRPITPAPRRGRRRGEYADVTLAQLSRVIAASRGPATGAPARARDAILAAQGPLTRGIEAALADVTLVGTGNVGAAYRPAYQAELVEIISWGTPTIDVMRQGDLERGDYPNKSFNTWTATPIVDIQTAEKTEIASGPVSIAPSSAPVKTFAGGNDISRQTVDLGSPSFVQDYIRAAGMDYALKTDTYAVNTLLAAATAVPTLTTDSFITILGKLIGALNPATTPPGGLFCAVPYQVGAGLIGVTEDNGPAFWNGHVNFGRMTAEITNDAGLVVYVDPAMPANTYLAGHRNAATWYDVPGSPFTLEAVNVGLLGLDIAVYGYGAVGVQYPGALVKSTPTVGP